MSQRHPNDDDDELARGHTEAALRTRVAWVKRLRAVLLPFVEKRATEADLAEAQDTLDNTKEWL